MPGTLIQAVQYAVRVHLFPSPDLARVLTTAQGYKPHGFAVILTSSPALPVYWLSVHAAGAKLLLAGFEALLEPERGSGLPMPFNHHTERWHQQIIKLSSLSFPRLIF